MKSGGPARSGLLRTHDTEHKRALLVGVGASAVLHIVVILLYAVGITQWGPRETVLAVTSDLRVSNDMRIVEVVEIETPDPTAEAPDEIAEVIAEIEVEAPDVGPPVPDLIDLSEPPTGRRAADVLRVRSSDTRLWREALPEAFELTEAQRMELQLAGKIEEWADSVALALAAEYALTDWTRTDAQGRRWGVSPGQLHLGDITIPLPFYFRGNAWQREQAMRTAWEDQDIRNGANAQALRSSWTERAEAIRRRRDRDRGGTPQVADTTGTFNP